MPDIVIIGLLIVIGIAVSVWVLNKTIKLVVLVVVFSVLAYFLLPYLINIGLPVPDFIQDLLNHNYTLSLNLVRR